MMQEKVMWEKKCQVFDTPLRIAISGKIASGKTTLSNSLVSLYNLERISFAKYLKMYCSAICDYNEKKDLKKIMPIVAEICEINGYNNIDFFKTTIFLSEMFKNVKYSFNPNSAYFFEVKKDDSRKMLQYVGNEMRKEYSDTIWIDCLMKSLDPNGRYIVDDMRYPNELEKLVESNFFLIRLDITPEEQERRIMKLYGKYDSSVLVHPTETLLDTSSFDFHINGNASEKNVVMKATSVLNQLDYLSSKIYEILEGAPKENDYRRNVLMGFKDTNLEDENSGGDNTSRFGYSDSGNYFG